MSVRLPATYDRFVERVFAIGRNRVGDLSFVSAVAGQFTVVGSCAFGAAAECGHCAKPVLNAEPFSEAVGARYGLNQTQMDDLFVRLLSDQELNATHDGICRRCHAEEGQR